MVKINKVQELMTLQIMLCDITDYNSYTLNTVYCLLGCLLQENMLE